jgi:hypothetical protein
VALLVLDTAAARARLIATDLATVGHHVEATLLRVALRARRARTRRRVIRIPVRPFRSDNQGLTSSTGAQAILSTRNSKELPYLLAVETS